MTTPTLTRRGTTGSPRAVVLMLHGGKPTSARAVGGRSASWQRMAALHRALAGPLAEDQVASWLLRYRERGWNGGVAPVDDARWALAEIRRTHPDIPVVLLGHSMGGRVAVHVADDHSVVGVCALAPWWEPTDPVQTLRGRYVQAAHARRDRITSIRRTSAYLARAQSIGVDTRLVDMGRHGHYLLTGIRDWNRVALEGVLSALPQRSSSESRE